MHVHNKVGNFIIGTETPAVMQSNQPRFLSVVLRHGVLWDFAVSNNEEDAASMHESFCFAAEMLDPVLTAKEQEGQNSAAFRMTMN